MHLTCWKMCVCVCACSRQVLKLFVEEPKLNFQCFPSKSMAFTTLLC